MSFVRLEGGRLLMNNVTECNFIAYWMLTLNARFFFKPAGTEYFTEKRTANILFYFSVGEKTMDGKFSRQIKHKLQDKRVCTQ